MLSPTSPVLDLARSALREEAQAAFARAQEEIRFALAALASAGVPGSIIDAALHAAQTLDSARLAGEKVA